MRAEQAPRNLVVSVRGLSKSFGSIDALRNVDLDIYAGELVAMVGDNGAGKSTFAKILSGTIKADSGVLQIGGRQVEFDSPQHALALGIHTVYQDLALVPTLDVTANLFLGRELTVGPFRFLRSRAMVNRARSFLKDLEVNVPDVAGRVIASMSGGQRQAVAIARAAFWAERLLILDEPTAALGVREARAALSLVRRLRDRGLAVLMISHVLPHIVGLADRIVVLRHGEKVADLTGDVSSDRLISLIVGYA